MLVLDHALSHQILKWLIDVNHTQITKDLGKEARIQKVQNCMLNAADIVIYRHPAINRFFGKRKFSVVRVAVAQVVPARTREGVHSIGNALCRLSALWTGSLNKLLALSKSISCG